MLICKYQYSRSLGAFSASVGPILAVGTGHPRRGAGGRGQRVRHVLHGVEVWPGLQISPPKASTKWLVGSMSKTQPRYRTWLEHFRRSGGCSPW